MPRLVVGLQAVLYILISPLSVGVVGWLKARLQGRRGPYPLQAYRDLGKLLRIAPTRPESSSGVYLFAPALVFTSYALLGLALPTIVVVAGPGMDLLLVIGLLSLARFVATLAAFDAGSPFGPMSAGRQWFIQVLAEPALLVLAYIFALSDGTTDLPHLVPHSSAVSLLITKPVISIALGALLFVLLAETGRLPFDRPGTHLELTMIEEGVALEYSGRALALMWWGYAMKLTFMLSLVSFIAVPPASLSGLTPGGLALSASLYFAKLGALLVALAIWETARSKMRLRLMLPQLMLAIGVLLFTLASVILKDLQVGG
ncbi:MAG TPA: NADH-quinone oxidoreductase subunit H [Streptosporangiaceae bacterium]|nr:NADH-quinone oxidoreductase subunit H [Streptosporangiaceae bacterium]